ncbi:MAG: hypothetical protein ACLQNE_16850 [Thermoguttaceae bacterium]
MTAGSAVASTIDVTVYPSGTNLSAPILWDGTPADGVQGSYPTGWWSGSFAANGTGYSKYGFSATQLENILGFDPTIGDLVSNSYYTKTNRTTESAGDWFLQIYTTPQTSGDYGSWYHDILNAEPYLANNLNAPTGQWNEWQTGSGPNQLTFGINGNQNGAYGDPTLSSVRTNSAYDTQTIAWLSLATATKWQSGFTGQVDGLSFTVTVPSSLGGGTRHREREL